MSFSAPKWESSGGGRFGRFGRFGGGSGGGGGSALIINFGPWENG